MRRRFASRWLSLVGALGLLHGAADAQAPAAPGLPCPSRRRKRRETAIWSSASGSSRPSSVRCRPRSPLSPRSSRPRPRPRRRRGRSRPSFLRNRRRAAPDGGSGAGSAVAFGGGSGGSGGGGSSPKFGLAEGKVAGWNNGFYIQSPDRQYILLPARSGRLPRLRSRPTSTPSSSARPASVSRRTSSITTSSASCPTSAREARSFGLPINVRAGFELHVRGRPRTRRSG